MMIDQNSKAQLQLQSVYAVQSGCMIHGQLEPHLLLSCVFEQEIHKFAAFYKKKKKLGKPKLEKAIKTVWKKIVFLIKKSIFISFSLCILKLYFPLILPDLLPFVILCFFLSPLLLIFSFVLLRFKFISVCCSQCVILLSFVVDKTRL